jgi:hypothetical protein
MAAISPLNILKMPKTNNRQTKISQIIDKEKVHLSRNLEPKTIKVLKSVKPIKKKQE